jgi:indolepyruvate decarboxylase
MSQTVIQYVLSRLKEEGVSDVFGVPGDYVYPVLDAILDDPDIEWRGNCNELNAGYAADGYARTKGLGAFCTTYGSELGSYLAMAGAFGEFSPVIMMTGYPSTAQQATGESWHHMLGKHEYSLFNDMARPMTAGGDAVAILTPENCVAEFERVLAAVLYHKQPGLLAFPADLVHQPIADASVPENIPFKDPQSDPVALRQAVDHIVDVMSKTKKACVIPGIKVRRAGLSGLASQLITSKGLPFATAFQDKATLDEGTPGFMGTWIGRFTNLEVEEFVTSCDCVLGLGPERHYFNAGFFTTQFDRNKSINVHLHSVRVGSAEYKDVEMKDVLEALIERLPEWGDLGAPSRVTPFTKITGGGEDPIDAGDPLYARLTNFLKPGDILVGDPGSPGLACNFLALPEGVGYESQALAASIGWGTPAAVGVAVGAPDRRVVQIGGEGSHQLTAQELGQFYKFGLKPVFITINNDGYLVERYTCRDPEATYNDLPQWQYSKLPEVFGCEDWYSVKVTTTGELDEALERANNCDTGVYIEVITDRYSMPPAAEVMFELTRPKFGQKITWKEWYSEYKKGNNVLAPKL